MKTIWKYPLQLRDVQTIKVPSLSNFEDDHGLIWGQVLHIGQQDGIPTLWMMVDSERDPREIEIRIIGTGHECPNSLDYDYLGTTICEPFVWHIFSKLL